LSEARRGYGACGLRTARQSSGKWLGLPFVHGFARLREVREHRRGKQVMNDARKRRPLIRARALKGRMYRIDKEIEVKCEHGILRNGMLCEACHPIFVRPETVRVAITLYDEFTISGKPFYMAADLPIDKLETTVQRMYHYGFWQRREGMMIFIPGGRILRIVILESDNVV
jgi:hypothetical protein